MQIAGPSDVDYSTGIGDNIPYTFKRGITTRIKNSMRTRPSICMIFVILTVQKVKHRPIGPMIVRTLLEARRWVY